MVRTLAIILTGEMRNFYTKNYSEFYKVLTRSRQEYTLVHIFMVPSGAYDSVKFSELDLNPFSIHEYHEDELINFIKKIDNFPGDMSCVRQVFQLNIGIDAITEYEKKNGMIFDFIFKTRFDHFTYFPDMYPHIPEGDAIDRVSFNGKGINLREILYNHHISLTKYAEILENKHRTFNGDRVECRFHESLGGAYLYNFHCIRNPIDIYSFNDQWYFGQRDKFLLLKNMYTKFGTYVNKMGVGHPDSCEGNFLVSTLNEGLTQVVYHPDQIRSDIPTSHVFISNPVALVVPIHPPKYKYFYNFLNNVQKNTIALDIYAIFASEKDWDLFEMKKLVRPIIMNEHFNENYPINSKKLHALNLLSNSLYDYIMTADGEIDIISTNFCKLQNKVDKIFSEKKIYAGETSASHGRQYEVRRIQERESHFLGFKEIDIVKRKFNNFNLWPWFSDFPVYKREHISDFLYKLKGHLGNFDHLCYQYYLASEHDWEVVNTTPITGINWSIEKLTTDNPEIISNLKKAGLGFGYVNHILLKNSQKYIGDDAIFLFHMDHDISQFTDF